MHTAAPHAVILARNGRWARLRVRGLLRNVALAAQIEAAGVEVLQQTGSIQVPLSAKRDEAYWLQWVSQLVEAQAPRRSPEAAAPPKPPQPRNVRAARRRAVQSTRQRNG